VRDWDSVIRSRPSVSRYGEYLIVGSRLSIVMARRLVGWPAGVQGPPAAVRGPPQGLDIAGRPEAHGCIRCRRRRRRRREWAAPVDHLAGVSCSVQGRTHFWLAARRTAVLAACFGDVPPVELNTKRHRKKHPLQVAQSKAGLYRATLCCFSL